MLTRRNLVTGAALSLAALKLRAQAPASPSGTWTGVLNRGSLHLRLKFEFTAAGSVTLYSLDQDNKPIPGRWSLQEDNRLEIHFRSIHARFVAPRDGESHLAGTWKQVFDTPLVLFPGEQGLERQAGPPPAPLTVSALEGLRHNCGAPAMGAAAARAGAAQAFWVTGNRSIGLSAAVEVGDSWHLGSITKSMTATLVARLVEAQVLSWNLKVSDVLSEAVPGMSDVYRAVTLRHLLSHQAGLPPDLSQVELLSFVLADAQEIRAQRRRFAGLALRMAPISAPQSGARYSNCGYVVAGAMLETVTGQSWEFLIRQYLFGPLGLVSAGFGPPDAGSIGRLDQPVGHAADSDALLLRLLGGKGLRAVRPGTGLQADNPRVMGPAATAHMKLADLLTYLAAHRDQSSLLQPESWALLHTPPFGGDYAMGWRVRSDGSLWHNGSNTFWYAEAAINRAQGLVAAVACNESRPAAMSAVGDALEMALAAV